MAPDLLRSAVLSIAIPAAAAALIWPSAASARPDDLLGGPVKSIMIVRDQAPDSTTAESFVVGRPRATVKVAAGTLLTVRFSAQTSCSRTGGTGVCNVWIRAHPVGKHDIFEFTPGAEAFDTANVPDVQSLPEEHSTDQSVIVKKAGTYEIEVSYALSRPDMKFELASWSMTIKTAPARQ